MRLRKIRAILAEYAKERGIRQRIFGDPAEVAKLKAFLFTHADKADDYFLTTADLIEIVKIGLMQSSFNSMQFLPEQLKFSYYLPQILARLDQAGLLNEANFEACYPLDFSDSHSLCRVLCAPELLDIPLNQKVFELILILYKPAPPALEGLRKQIMLLNAHDLITEKVLSLMKNKQRDLLNMNLLVKVILSLHEANLLESHASLMEQEKCDGQFFKLVNVLMEARLLDDELLSRLLDQKEGISFLFLKNIFLLKKAGCLNKKAFLTLLNEDFAYQDQVLTILSLMFDHGILSETSLEIVFQGEDLRALKRLLNILAKADILDQPVNYLPLPYTNDIFLSITGYLSEENLLNVEILNNIALLYQLEQLHTLGALFKTFSEENFHVDKENLNRILLLNNLTDLNFICTKLAISKIANNENLSLLLALSTRDRQIAKDMFIDLADCGLLDQASFNEALKRVQIKLAPVVLDTLTGEVEASELAQAKREIKYNRLLGRDSSCFFHKDNVQVVTKSLSATGLHELDAVTIQSQPFAQRLKWLISGLTDLHVLHANHRIHGNISVESFTIDDKKALMSLVDFNASRKRYSEKFPYDSCRDTAFAEFFKSQSFCDDMYSMGFVVAHIFPELFFLNNGEGQVEIESVIRAEFWRQDITTEMEDALAALVISMMQPVKGMRCSSQEALQYCQQLLEHKQRLNMDMARKIVAATIGNPEPAVDDALHGVTRFSI